MQSSKTRSINSILKKKEEKKKMSEVSRKERTVDAVNGALGSVQCSMTQ